MHSLDPGVRYGSPVTVNGSSLKRSSGISVWGVGKIMRANSPVRVVVFVFCMILLRCSLTVYSLRFSRLAISLLVNPSIR